MGPTTDTVSGPDPLTQIIYVRHKSMPQTVSIQNLSSNANIPCADPDKFDRGGPTLTVFFVFFFVFFYVGRGSKWH